jgi:hypothetical protein
MRRPSNRGKDWNEGPRGHSRLFLDRIATELMGKSIDASAFYEFSQLGETGER